MLYRVVWYVYTDFWTNVLLPYSTVIVEAADASETSVHM
jgi:hypothetical protein